MALNESEDVISAMIKDSRMTNKKIPQKSRNTFSGLVSNTDLNHLFCLKSKVPLVCVRSCALSVYDQLIEVFHSGYGRKGRIKLNLYPRVTHKGQSQLIVLQRYWLLTPFTVCVLAHNHRQPLGVLVHVVQVR